MIILIILEKLRYWFTEAEGLHLTGTQIKSDENGVKTVKLTALKMSFRISTESGKKGKGDFAFLLKKQQTKQMGDILDSCLPNVEHQRVFFPVFHFEHGGGDILMGFGLASSSYMSCT